MADRVVRDDTAFRRLCGVPGRFAHDTEEGGLSDGRTAMRAPRSDVRVEALVGHRLHGADGPAQRTWGTAPGETVHLGAVHLERVGGGGGEERVWRQPPTTRLRGGRTSMRVVNEAGQAVATRVTPAMTMLRRARGLLGRGALEPDEGLWIEPCNAVHALGMRMAIDAVYVDREGRILAIAAPLRPWRLGPVVRGAHSVLELAEGTAARLGLAVGDRLRCEPVTLGS